MRPSLPTLPNRGRASERSGARGGLPPNGTTTAETPPAAAETPPTAADAPLAAASLPEAWVGRGSEGALVATPPPPWPRPAAATASALARWSSFARQTCPRFGAPQRWHRFLNACPASRSLRPFSIRCQRLRTDETDRPAAARARSGQRYELPCSPFVRRRRGASGGEDAAKCHGEQRRRRGRCLREARGAHAPGSESTMRDHFGPSSPSSRRIVLSSSGSHARICSCTPPVIARLWMGGAGSVVPSRKSRLSVEVALRFSTRRAQVAKQAPKTS